MGETPAPRRRSELRSEATCVVARKPEADSAAMKADPELDPELDPESARSALVSAALAELASIRASLQADLGRQSARRRVASEDGVGSELSCAIGETPTPRRRYELCSEATGARTRRVAAPDQDTDLREMILQVSSVERTVRMLAAR